MLNPWKSSPDHEALFIERYDKLLKWALMLTENDGQLAEDLVQDAFIQVTLNPPDLRGIHNIDAYYYGILRHLHLSHIRRAAQRHLQQLTIVDCDSAESGLRSIDPRDQIQVQHELRSICHYACLRKDSAKAASILILRFFHGYYPSEIAQLTRNSTLTINVWLRNARAEAKLVMRDPKGPSFLCAPPHNNAKVFPVNFTRSSQDLLSELRQTVFRYRVGECFSRTTLQEIYSAAVPDALECKVLSHIVSCESCLFIANDLLGLPQLSERYPSDNSGNETRKKGGPSGGAAPGGGQRRLSREQRSAKHRQRVREVFEHLPQELCVSINGYTRGSQRVSSVLSELTLTIDQDEQVNFVEVFSEQSTRLLLMSVDERPPDGPPKQTTRISLSEGRTLEVRLKFSSPWPILEMSYEDPTFVSEAATKTLVTQPIVDVGSLGTEDSTKLSEARVLVQPSSGLLASARRRLTGLRSLKFGMLASPGWVTCLVALLLISTLAILYRRLPSSSPLTASGLLQQAIVAEDAIASRRDQVLHRTLDFKEKSSTGQLLAHRRIEIWHSAAKGITASRVYDERGTLVAGIWTRADGVQTVYHHGQRPLLQIRNAESTIRNLEDVWQLSGSAKEFTFLVQSAGDVRVEQQNDAYLLNYDRHLTDSPQGLLKASLVLSRVDLHATEQRLTVQRGNEVREYSFAETSFERRPANAVAPSFFEPESVLLPSTSPTTLNPTASILSRELPPVLATAELEVEALRLVNLAGADTREQIAVTRTSEGVLLIQGLVETADRKSEILRTLSSLAHLPAVHIQIETFAEAEEAQRRIATRQTDKSATVEVQRVETATDAIPAAADLRRHLDRIGLANDEDIRKFASRMLSHSRQAMSHAAALKRLMQQFSPGDLSSLSPEARTKWLALIQSHARAFERETALLRRELQPIFFPDASVDGTPETAAPTDDAALSRAVERLFELGTANERMIENAFSISSDHTSALSIKTSVFLRSLHSSEALANRISSATPQ